MLKTHSLQGIANSDGEDGGSESSDLHQEGAESDSSEDEVFIIVILLYLIPPSYYRAEFACVSFRRWLPEIPLEMSL